MRPRRIYDINKVSQAITTKFGRPGGQTESTFRKYQPCAADVTSNKEAVIVPTAAENGTLQGFSQSAPWSNARWCDCVGCLDPDGILIFLWLLPAVAAVARSSGEPRPAPRS